MDYAMVFEIAKRLGELDARVKTLEVELAAHKAKEAETEKREREKLYHGVG